MSEARDNLAEALTLFFETASAGEVDRRMRGEVYVTHVEVAVGRARSELSIPARFANGSRLQVS